MSSSCQSQARCLHALGGETLRFSGNAAPGVAEVGSPKCRGLEREFDLHVKILKKRKRSEQPRIWVVESPMSALRERWSIWCDPPAMQICNRLWAVSCDKKH